MTIHDEIRLLVHGLANLEQEFLYSDLTTDELFDLTERINTINHCLRLACIRLTDRRRS